MRIIQATMLDERTEKILSAVIKECGTGYKILCADDFGDEKNVNETLNKLAETGYISMRYSGGGDYLVTPLLKAREYFEEKQNEYLLRGLLYKKVALYSFFGAIAGSFVAMALGVFIRWIYAG